MEHARLRMFAEDHHGLISKEAAARFGMSSTTWFRALADGRLELVHRGVARLPGAVPSRTQAVAAACLATGGLASHRTAAFLWGIPAPKTIRSRSS